MPDWRIDIICRTYLKTLVLSIKTTLQVMLDKPDLQRLDRVLLGNDIVTFCKIAKQLCLA